MTVDHKGHVQCVSSAAHGFRGVIDRVALRCSGEGRLTRQAAIREGFAARPRSMLPALMMEAAHMWAWREPRRVAFSWWCDNTGRRRSGSACTPHSGHMQHRVYAVQHGVYALEVAGPDGKSAPRESSPPVMRTGCAGRAAEAELAEEKRRQKMCVRLVS